MSTHDSDGNQSAGYSCSECGDRFDDPNALGGHAVHCKGATNYPERVDVECWTCGESKSVKPSRVEKSDRFFCDRECQAEYQKTVRGEAHPRWKGGPVTVSCAYCGESKKIERDQYDESMEYFCGYECHGEYKMETQAGAANPNWRGGPIQRQCERCGTEITVHAKRRKNREQVFCSRSCLAEHRFTGLTGPDHPAFRGGPIPYGEGWNEEKKEAVREAYGRRCDACGMSGEEHKEQYGCRLAVHHIQKARTFDDAEKRNAMDNLVALCLRHHRKAERMSPLYPYRS